MSEAMLTAAIKPLNPSESPQVQLTMHPDEASRLLLAWKRLRARGVSDAEMEEFMLSLWRVRAQCP